MKSILLTFILVVFLNQQMNALGTIWSENTGSIIYDIDFTPDDKYVVAWNSEIQFWDALKGTKEYSISTESTGDFNFNKQFLVFTQNKTPKLLNWKTKEVKEGFASEPDNLGRIRTAKSRNEFMSKLNGNDSTIYFWDINSKRKIDSFSIEGRFKTINVYWKRKIIDFDYVGNNDEYFYITLEDNNHLIQGLPLKNRQINTSNLFFNRFSKDITDSIYMSTYDISNPIYIFNYISVLNDRNKILMNKSGGKMIFYNVELKTVFDEFVFSNDSAGVNDIYSSKNDSIIAIASDRNTKIIDLTKNELLQSYDYEVNHIALSNLSDFIALGGNELISLREKDWVKSKVTIKSLGNIFKLNPNPTTNNINISFGTPINDYMKLGIIDLLGNEIFIIDQGYILSSDYQTNFNVSTLPSGTYFIRLEIGNDIITKQFIKE